MAGELIEAQPDNHWPLVELRDVLMGLDTDFEIGPGPIGGLGLPAFKTSDLDNEHADGMTPGRDYYRPLTITVPLVITGSDPNEAMDNLAVMRIAWGRVTDGVDIEMHLQLPGEGHVYVVGRPRGLVEDLESLRGGVVHALATFVTTGSHELTPVGS